MKKHFTARLAWTGLRKNARLYVPYLLSVIGMVMMTYIIESLSRSTLLAEMPRGGTGVGLVLGLGRFVIGLFSLLFLFYTNSFLMRRRYGEFGLYNVLGMDKRGISRLIVWESFFVAVIGLAGGIGLGIVFSKFAELGLLRAIRAEIDYRFTVSGESVLFTVAVFFVIFFLLTVRSLLRVRKNGPLALLKSENEGEKPPKANPVAAIAGLILLIGAYVLAVTDRSATEALFVFFIAVLMVIAATYLLFIAGSVFLCRVLKRSKRYYYKKQHFVSVSSMTFRMKRNGAGLASICILCTMVLVMISSTTSLFFGAEDMMRSMHPLGTEFSVSAEETSLSESEFSHEIATKMESAFTDFGVVPQNVTSFHYAVVAGVSDNGTVQPDPSLQNSLDFNSLRELYFISAEDAASLTGRQYDLSGNDVLLGRIHCDDTFETLTVGDNVWHVVGYEDITLPLGEIATYITPCYIVITSDEAAYQPLRELTGIYGYPLTTFYLFYGYDLDADDETIEAVYDDQFESLFDTEDTLSVYSACFVTDRQDYYELFGGLFFLGILLSVLFLFGAVTILYYKQITEGYEDVSRFEIMRKVGMTKDDIKKSVNSQVLTVFFTPLLGAGLHLAFAFPLIWKILQLFGLRDMTYVLVVTGLSYLAFCLLYALLYKITAGAYYKIVSSSETQ